MYNPEGCKILIEADTAEAVTSGGLFIPKTVQAKEQISITKGKVLAIGPSAIANFTTDDGAGEPLKIGDKVLFAKYGGFYVQEDGKDLRFINDKDIIARID